MIRHIDSSLLSPLDKLGLVLHRQHRLPLGRLASRVHDARLHGAREPFVAIFTTNLEDDALPAFFDVVLRGQPWDVLPDAHGRGPLPDLLAPSFGAAVQVVGPVIGAEFVRLPVVQGDDRVLDAVGHAADGGAEVGRIVRFVGGLGGEALHDVGPRDVEGLEDGAEGE